MYTQNKEQDQKNQHGGTAGKVEEHRLMFCVHLPDCNEISNKVSRVSDRSKL